MNEKSWLIMRIVACLYVIYLGIKLVAGMLTDRPENMVLMMAAGIFFIVAGAAIVIFSVKDLLKLNKRLAEENTKEQDTEAIEEDSESEDNLVEAGESKEDEQSDTDANREVILDIAEENDETATNEILSEEAVTEEIDMEEK